MEPVNIKPGVNVLFTMLPHFNKALADKQVTVEDAIDIMAETAKAVAREAGVADKPIMVVKDRGEE